MLVAKVFNQIVGIDYPWNFYLVVKPQDICIFLSMALAYSWPINILDMYNIFLNRDMSETVYMLQSLSLDDTFKPGYMCKLKKALYGLNQASCSWYQS